MSKLTSGSFTRQGTHQIAYRVYYEDTDAAGVMYYANYLKFAERARTEALRACGIEQSELLTTERVGFVVRRCEVAYHAPATLDDVVIIDTALTEMSGVRFRMKQRLMRGEADLAEVETEIVMVDAAMKPVRIPERISDLLAKHLKISLDS